MMTIMGSRKLKTKTTTNFLAADVFNGRIMNAVHATTAASMMASSMHTAFSLVYTCPQVWPISTHGCEGSHCNAAAKTAPNAQSAVAIMMP